ncbi:hypothetical protein HUT19_13070 [Streptomyces sp. NA02950]|uniref:DUF6571 family protein n=1 Tax=Streptomyces sp. NA02950 TaxID=2742137 RepID=UPI001590D9E1|nr:DUF6571 family protein [Streptomyces sp. NA02950]QKV92564.1 hypothetical protein HUT19_13070 [Streptomyces sp. NA02950]
MARLTFDDLYHVSFKSLGAAADDWKEMVDQLDTLATDAKDGMVKQSDAARWSGVTADVTRPFVRKTGKEFRDAHTEAKAICSMLRDAHTDLTEIQSDLRTAVDVDAKKSHIRVTGLDGGTVSCVAVGRQGDTNQETPKQAGEREALESRINGLIAQADEIDNSVTRALKKIHGGDSHNFGHATYDSLDDAQAERAVYLARQALEPGRGWESKLSGPELAELKQLLAGNRKDREFAVDFYQSLGATNALRFQEQIALGAPDGADTARFKLAHSIQVSMGEALATATRQPGGEDNPNTAFREDKDYLGKSWVNELKRVGKEYLPSDPWGRVGAVHGYQVLSTLLRHGKYDKDFLVPIAQDMVTFDRKNPNEWVWAERPGGEQDCRLNLGKKGGLGWDPIPGLLEGLGHSPEASTEFFHESTGGGRDDGLEKLRNLDYFLGDKDGKNHRWWAADEATDIFGGGAKGADYGKEALGHALESATSGRAYDSAGPARDHTLDQAELFSTVVRKVAANPDLFKGEGGLAPIAGSLGNMSAEYMHDIQRVYAGGDDSGYIKSTGFAPDVTESEDLGVLDRFLKTTAEDPEAYASITQARQTVTTEMIREALTQRGEGDSLAQLAASATDPGGRIAGLTATGRADAIAAADNSVEKIEEYNEKLADRDKWVGRFVDLGASYVPVAGDVLSWASEDIREATLEHMIKDPEGAARQIEENREAYVNSERERTAQATKRAFYSVATDAGLDPTSSSVKRAATEVYQRSSKANSMETL